MPRKLPPPVDVTPGWAPGEWVYGGCMPTPGEWIGGWMGLWADEQLEARALGADHAPPDDHPAEWWSDLSRGDLLHLELVARAGVMQLVSDVEGAHAGRWGKPVVEAAAEGDATVYKCESDRLPVGGYIAVATVPFDDTLPTKIQAIIDSQDNPSIQSMDILLQWKAMASGGRLGWGPSLGMKLTQTASVPHLGGLISSRVMEDLVVDLIKVPREENGTCYASACFSTRSPFTRQVLQALQDRPKFAQSLLEEEPPDYPHAVFALNYMCGTVLEPVSPGLWRVSFMVHTNPHGNLPRWASEMGVLQAAQDQIAHVLRGTKL